MSDKKKELRTSMSALENFLTLLMPVSVGASLYLVTTATGTVSLVQAVLGISLFYGLWALLNLFTTKPYEKGHFAFFTCALGCGGALRDAGHFTGYLAVIGAAGCLAAFMIAGKRVLGWPASKTAHVSKKTLYWVYVMQAYFLASFALWGLVTYKLYGALL